MPPCTRHSPLRTTLICVKTKTTQNTCTLLKVENLTTGFNSKPTKLISKSANWTIKSETNKFRRNQSNYRDQ